MDLANLEILAPAGGMAELEAAVAAGADAVYFGMKKLNARQGAGNFAPEVLKETVAFLHRHNVKGYLTLNIDLTQREIGLAARSLEAARQAKVDAVLIRDAALLELIPFFPELAFHFSTQAAISSSDGVRAARALGLKRVVLARELSAAEIRSAAAVPGVEIEVFVQGALCFSCSGRCLLSSWGGGRSGNRGACTSPCRVSWHLPDGKTERPLSMFDLCLADQLPELAACGVRSLKIEGRLKSPAWVSKAVSLYRQARNGSAGKEELQHQAGELGAYSGRRLSNAFFTGTRQGITGEAGRLSNPERPALNPHDETKENGSQPVLSLHMDERQATIWQFSWDDRRETLRIPPQRIASAKRAVTVQTILDALSSCPPGHLKLSISAPKELQEKLLPRRCLATVQDALQDFLRRAGKEAEGTVRIKLPPMLHDFLERKTSPCQGNRLMLGDSPDRFRLGLKELPWFRKYFADHPEIRAILTAVPSADFNLQEYRDLVRELSPCLAALALPQIVYEDQLENCRQLLSIAREAGLPVEINSWDTWFAAQAAGVGMEAGPGMAVLNANAARFLEAKGCRCVAVSCEIDAGQLEDLCRNAVTPLSLCIFARPPLMQTRVELPQSYAPEQTASFEDARGIALHPRREGPHTVLHPQQPYDWRNLKNPRVRVQHLVLDLSGSTDPSADLSRRQINPFLFNYDRKLR